MVQNEAAWLTSASEYPFTVREAPVPKPGPGELVIKNVAVAINPVDWKIQVHGRYLSTYPFILGEDAAGIVEEVGPNVTHFKRGDRVIAHCHAIMTTNPSHSGFQKYPLVTESLTSRIPDFMSFEQAVVLPLAISTACSGLYPKDLLNLPLPSADKPAKSNKSILIWGGASSVGITAIQLAAASGITIITTASPANHELVTSLGADLVFDYRSPTVIEDIANALCNTEFIGVYDAIGEDPSFDSISALLDRLNKKVPVASVLPTEKRTELFAPVYVVAFSIIQEPNQYIGEWIWKRFIPQALENGSFQAKPNPLIAGHGLGAIQSALDLQRKGVSAKKVIVTL